MAITRYPLGARPSPPDHRDYRIQAAGVLDPAMLPVSRIITPNQPVRNQGQEGTCVGHALASGVLGHQQLVTPSEKSPFDRTLSVRDAYEGARQTELTIGEGAHPRAALKYAQKTGICLEADWPYQAGKPGAPGSNAAGSRASNRIRSYASVHLTTLDLKAAMHVFGPLLVVIPVLTGFYAPDRNGIVKHEGSFEGYHAVALVGWDDGAGVYRLRNSWGPTWGQAGYCWLPMSYPITEAWSVIPDFTAAPAPARPVPWWDPLFSWWPW